MERLPYIDEHRIRVAATREDVWRALMSVFHRSSLGPGDTLPGFAVVESEAPVRLALGGRHRFSRYMLVFELDATGPADCTLRAQTWAAFPGLWGRAYRAVVIGTGGHRLIVRRMLGTVARRA